MLQFKKGTWELNSDKIDSFIARLEKCMNNNATIGDDPSAIELLAFVKENKMYNHNHLHLLEAIEYESVSDGKDWGDLIF